MSIHEDFLRFIAWANKEGFDVAHSVGDGKYICLNPQTAELWKAWKASKYTPSSNGLRFGFDISGSKPDILPATNGDDVTDTRQALAALLPCPFCGNSKGLAVANENPQDLSGGYFIVCPSCDASTGLRFACGEDPIPLLIEQWNRRAALSAQPVAGAVATDETGWLIEHSGEILPGAEQRAQVSWLRVQMKFNGYGAREFGFTHDANEALRFARKEDAEAVLAMHLGASPPDWYSKPFSVTEHMWPAASQAQAAPAPEPSAQAVMMELEQRLIEIAKALPPMTTLGWNDGGMCEPDEAIKGYTKKQVLEILAQHLSTSPHPEPSAQDVGMLAVEELHQLGYTVKDGLLYPPTAETQPALAALFDLAAVLTGPGGKAAIHGSDGDMKIIDNALQTLRTSIINWTKS